MTDATYPEYVQRLLAQAEAEHLDDEGDPGTAAAFCYEVLALFPEHAGAAALVHQILSRPRLIREMRKAIGRHVDEWDDQPWQARRRLALSYRFLSRWEEADDYLLADDGMWPDDVREMAEEGRYQLLQAYLIGQARGAEIALVIFEEAIARTADPRQMLLSAAYLFADQGFFADAVEMLERLLAQFPGDAAARRLWAEVRWWRDHAHRVPWIPPAEDGRAGRFQRVMARLEPDYPDLELAAEPPLAHIPPDAEKLPADFALPPQLPPELEAALVQALGESAEPPADTPVDWSYLDVLESGAVDVAKLPSWAQYLLRELDNPAQETAVLQLILSLLADPPDEER